MLTYISSEGDHSLCVPSRFALHGLKLYCTACSRSSLEMNRSWHYYSELSYCTNRYKYRMQDEKKLNIFRVVISEVSCLCKFSRQRFFISNCYKIRCGSSNEKKERRRQLVELVYTDYHCIFKFFNGKLIPRNWVLDTYSNFLILISLQHNVIDFRYFKLWILCGKIIWGWKIRDLTNRLER